MDILINYFYFFLYGVLTLLSVNGMWFVAAAPGVDDWTRRFFHFYYITLMLSCLAGFMDGIFLYLHAGRAAIQLILILDSLLPSVPLPMLTVYLLHASGADMRRSRLLRAVLALWAVYLGLLCSTVFVKGFLFTVTDGYYARGHWYPVVLLPLIAILLLNLKGVLHYRKSFSRKTTSSLLVAILPLMGAILIQLFLDVFPLVDVSIVLTAAAMFNIILSDRFETMLRDQQEIIRQQMEIAHQRASIMVLQMRPHFIYNTLTSVYALCNKDAGLARQVIMDFTTYLRKNFTAVASAEPIPFSSELDHTRAYLAVEQAQYQDSLFVTYDTPHTFFRVPPLTLQPIVENAVKHGRDPYAGPFHITIRTEKTKTGSRIVVEDDGKGFTGASDSEPHIALNNIRQRLEMMCGGSLSITPGEGGGTAVTVSIPDGG